MKNMHTDAAIARLLPWPSVESNKYTRGKVVIVAGSKSYPGAAILASRASQRAGAGYTETFAEDSIVFQVQLSRPSLVVRPWSSFASQPLSDSSEHHPCAYVVGPGFDAADSLAFDLVERVLKDTNAPVLVDGGALRVLCDEKLRALCKRRFEEGYTTVITPHGGEAASLAQACGIDQTDPASLAAELAQAYGVVTVLKGSDTYISEGDEAFCMNEGTPALAKAGTGDVLAGIIGALLAQGMDAMEAGVLGTSLHARAGILAARDFTEISVCPEEIVEYLPRAISSFAGRRRTAQ